MALSAAAIPGQRFILTWNQMNKPTAVIDKSLLQGLLELSATEPELSAQLIAGIKENYQIVITLVLIEEVIVNYVELPIDRKELPRRMLDEILRFYPCWMETPLQLIFREFILKQPISSNLGLEPQMANLVWQTVENPDSRWKSQALA